MTVTPDIYKRVKDFIREKSLIFKGERMLLSLSAGKDSMAMLHLMMKIREELGFEIGLFHLNHQRRGDESDQDERHLRRLAEENGIESHIKTYDFSKGRKRLSFEEHAREIRYSLLEKTAAKYNFHRIATAHSLDDHTETLVMRIFTGTGIYGLRSIPYIRGKIIRPLIKVTSQEIYSYLEENGISWREDSSNRDMNITRNAVREKLVPVIGSIFPAYRDVLGRLAEQAEENSGLLERLFLRSFPRVINSEKGKVYARIDDFDNDEAILKYLISYVLRKYFNEMPGSGMLNEAVRNIGRNRSNLQVYSNRKVTIEKVRRKSIQLISFTRGVKPREAAGKWEYEVSIGNKQKLEIRETGVVLEIEQVDYGYYEKKSETNNIFVSIDPGICSIIIRNRRDGDRIKCIFGTKKLKDLLIEKKLDNVSKNCVPLIIVNSSVAACFSGIFEDQKSVVAADHLATDKSKKILRIQKICG